MLNLIRAHAILHQAARERDVAGRIVATLDDYEVVRELLADIISEGVEATVSPAIRETVETIRRILAPGSDEVSITQLAQALGLDKSAASRRAASAVQQGFLRNLEDRKGRPARLCLGEPIPEPLSSCRRGRCCTVAVLIEGRLPPPSPLEWQDPIFDAGGMVAKSKNFFRLAGTS